MESGKNVTFFEQLFCFYQLVLVVWNTFGAKFKLPFISWVKQNWHFLRQCRKKLPFPHLGGLLGETGSGKNHSSGRGFSRGLHDSPLSTRSPYHLYSFSGVRHVCHDNDGWFVRVYADPRIQGYNFSDLQIFCWKSTKISTTCTYYREILNHKIKLQKFCKLWRRKVEKDRGYIEEMTWKRKIWTIKLSYKYLPIW